MASNSDEILVEVTRVKTSLEFIQGDLKELKDAQSSYAKEIKTACEDTIKSHLKESTAERIFSNRENVMGFFDLLRWKESHIKLHEELKLYREIRVPKKKEKFKKYIIFAVIGFLTAKEAFYSMKDYFWGKHP